MTNRFQIVIAIQHFIAKGHSTMLYKYQYQCNKKSKILLGYI